MKNTDQLIASGVKATSSAAATSVVGGLWAWFGTNAQAIGSIASIIGALCAVIGLAYTLYQGRKRSNQIHSELHNKIDQLIENSKLD